MSGTINVNTDRYLEEATRLADAFESFKADTESITEDFQSSLEGFNSDFNANLKWVLKRFNSDSGPELVADIKEHLDKIKTLADTFASAEDDLTLGITGGNRRD